MVYFLSFHDFFLLTSFPPFEWFLLTNDIQLCSHLNWGFPTHILTQKECLENGPCWKVGQENKRMLTSTVHNNISHRSFYHAHAIFSSAPMITNDAVDKYWKTSGGFNRIRFIMHRPRQAINTTCGHRAVFMSTQVTQGVYVYGKNWLSAFHFICTMLEFV